MKTFRKLFLALMLSGVFATASKAEEVNRIVAVINDSIVTLQQLELLIEPSMQAAHEQFSSQPLLYRQKVLEVHTNGLEYLIRRELILHEFATLQGKVPDAIVDRIVEDEIHRTQPDRIQFIKKLQEEGTTFEQYRKKVRDDLIVRELSHDNVKEPIISPHRIELYYNQHLADFKIEDQVKTRMIVVNQSVVDDPGAAKRRAAEILSRIKEGATFDEMAKVYSEGARRNRGAPADWMELSKLAEALREPITKLNPGQCSDVIETKDACFLVQLDERRPAHYTPLSEVRNQIEYQLISEEKTRLLNRWIERLRKKTFLRSYD